MKASEANNVVEISSARRSGKPRQGRMPKVIDLAVAYLKSAEREALLKSLSADDPAVAEMLRVAAATYDAATKLVLHAFDDVTRNPTI